MVVILTTPEAKSRQSPQRDSSERDIFLETHPHSSSALPRAIHFNKSLPTIERASTLIPSRILCQQAATFVKSPSFNRIEQLGADAQTLPLWENIQFPEHEVRFEGFHLANSNNAFANRCYIKLTGDNFIPNSSITPEPIEPIDHKLRTVALPVGCWPR